MKPENAFGRTTLSGTEGKILFCEKCNKNLHFMDLLNENELKNSKRTKLIDKMLI